MAHNRRPMYGRSSSDAALNFSITESQNGQYSSRSNGSVPSAMRAAYAEASRENGYRLSRGSSRDEYQNGSSRLEHHQHGRGDLTLPRNPAARHQVRHVSRETNTEEELWKRKTASLPRPSKGKQQRSAFYSPSEAGDGYSKPVYNRQNSAGDSIHTYGQREDMHMSRDQRNIHHHSVTRASSFQFGSEVDYGYRANQTVQQSQSQAGTSSSRTLQVEYRSASVHRSNSPVEDDRFRGYSIGSRGSSPRPNMRRTNSYGNAHKVGSGSEADGEQSSNTSFSSSVGSPGKKKLSRKPSFKAFGSLIQKMVRQIGSMEEGKGSHSKTDKPSGSSSVANGETENHPPPTSPPCSPILLHGRIPGLSGLRNHGNTCFMNSIVQCLSNTDILAEYFVLEQYREDLSHSKKVSKKFGTKGEVTEQFAVLLKAIWSCKYSPHHTTEFKRIVARHGSQFRGNDQHDAQEFLIWLLDKVHEDLNSAKKKYKQLKNGQNKSDELMAAESLANHMRRNNSFVQDLFQAQYRSSLTCPHCGKQSNTFDPFLCVSLPIPQRTTRVVIVVVIYADRDPRVVRFGIVLETSGTVADLRSTIASTCSIAVTRVVLTEVYFDGFYRSFGDAQPLSDVHDGDSIYAVETPNNPHSMLQNSQVKPFLHVHCNRPVEVITLVIINQQGTGRSGKRFGQPMAIEVERNVSHEQLTLIILKAMGCSSANADKIMQSGPVLQLGIVIDAKGSRHYIPVEEARPMHNATITRMLQGASEEGGPPHVKAIVEWERDIRPMFCQRAMSIYIEEHESVQKERSSHQQPVRASLFDCIDLYTQEEKLGEDNAWNCSHCKRLQQGTKKLTLWSLPDVLILHLKRFKQVGTARTKLSTLVDFPIRNLNMGQYIEHRRMSLGLPTNGNSQAALLNSLTAWSPWKQQGGRSRASTMVGDNVYDLYAVCNHTGGLTGGHYTAYCNNSLDGQWYHFDDAKVVSIPEERLVNKGAYLLFYHRRTPTAGSTSTDCSMSSTSSDHWVFKLPAYARQCSNTSSGQDSVFSSGGSSHDGSSPMTETPPPGAWGSTHSSSFSSQPTPSSHSPRPASSSHSPRPASSSNSPHPASSSHSPRSTSSSYSSHPTPSSHSPRPTSSSHSPHPASSNHSPHPSSSSHSPHPSSSSHSSYPTSSSHSPHPAPSSHSPHPTSSNHSPHPSSSSHSPHPSSSSHSTHPSSSSHSSHPPPSSHSPHPPPSFHSPLPAPSDTPGRYDLQRQDLPELYNNQNGVDGTDSTSSRTTKSSGRFTPGHRSLQGSRDLVEDDESAGFSPNSRPFVRGVAEPPRQRSSHKPWENCESDTDSVLTESCV